MNLKKRDICVYEDGGIEFVYTGIKNIFEWKDGREQGFEPMLNDYTTLKYNRFFHLHIDGLKIIKRNLSYDL